tara:strand:- start:4756 stop:5844 length:1089 start_codon:yes stop_codon:yes gene_type:complete
MRILYISPENTVGTLNLWKKEHERRGNECRTLTFFKSPKNFEDDICLDLPFNFTYPWMSSLRNYIYKFYRGEEGYFKEKKGYPPKWSTEGIFDHTFLKFKDWLWKPMVKKAINDFDLYNFDVVHFESGMDFLKNEFFVKELKERGKKIICHYHGEDLRTRGVMPFIDKVSDINLTNELDLLDKHPNIKYIFLPFSTSDYFQKTTLNKKLQLSHAPTNRYYKGSQHIIKVCQKLHNEGKIKFDLIEGLPHAVAMKHKANSDIFIDQIGNKGGWGYGMNSIESLSMGICTLTEMNDIYNEFISDHPFLHIEEKNLEKTLRDLIENREKITELGNRGKEWVEKNHNVKTVADTLYSYYRDIGLDV